MKTIVLGPPGTGKTTTSSSAFVNLGTDGNMEMTAKNLRARRSEIEEERKQIDSGRPSVADALQKLRGGDTNGISATNAAPQNL